MQFGRCVHKTDPPRDSPSFVSRVTGILNLEKRGFLVFVGRERSEKVTSLLSDLSEHYRSELVLTPLSCIPVHSHCLITPEPFLPATLTWDYRHGGSFQKLS